MVHKLLKICVALLFIVAVVVGLTSRMHPIILKLIAGSARIIGRPSEAAIYTNGQINSNIKLYKVDTYWGGGKANYYLLYLPKANTKDTRAIISLNLQDGYAGRPSSTNKKDYDVILGRLLQSDVGAHFSRFADQMKGYGFDPKLTFRDKQIKLNVSCIAKVLRCDSIRIEL